MRYLSVCSGIEAATAAWHPLGWQAVAYSEIEPFPSAVLAHHYPTVPNWQDMTKYQEWPDATFDVLVGGTPCQSFSVAGLRKGLADPRGNLALVYLGIADRYRPEWLVWENVPGVLSSNQGRDFGAFLGGLAELGYGFAYRVLDAQYFGLAQRRKRVFVVANSRSWKRAAAVLFEPASLRGDPAPCREAGERTAPTLAARTRGGGGLGTDFDCDGGLIAFGGGNQAGSIDVATAQTAQTAHGGTGRLDFESETFVAHALRAEGFDASEDGTGRGTPIVPVQGVALRGREGGATAELTGETMTALRTGGGGGDKPHVLLPFDETQITSSQNRCNPQPGDPSHPLASGSRPPTIAFSAKDHGADAMDDLSPTLRAGGHNESHANAGVMPAVMQGWRVRRLTPRECERLQGFPDDYTAIPYRGKPAADGPRYKALGNSMAVPVMRWIGERIAAVNQFAVPTKEAAE
jgi:DNA (cytosine-5)-methyltransferase 1